MKNRKLNVIGPFSMGVWTKPGFAPVGNEEALTGRSLLMAKNLRKFLLESFRLKKSKRLMLSTLVPTMGGY